MGYTSALGMAKATDLETALSWHFTANHFPPLPTTLIPAAMQAIAMASDEEWDEAVELPEGITYKGQNTAPVAAMVEAWHLGAFIDAAREQEL